MLAFAVMDKLEQGLKRLSRTGSISNKGNSTGAYPNADVEKGPRGDDIGSGILVDPNNLNDIVTRTVQTPSAVKFQPVVEEREYREDANVDPSSSLPAKPQVNLKPDNQTPALARMQTKTNDQLGAGPDKTKTDNDGTSSSNETDGWRTVFNSYKKLDDNWVQNINDDIGTLLIFAGLFSTVLTAFLVEVYDDLQPDKMQSLASVPVLIDISKQLHAISLGQVATPTTVLSAMSTPSTLRVATTALWALSLILSLGAALFGILAKQWVREYMRWTSIYPFQHALHIRYYRRRSLDRWHVEEAVVVVWMCLIFGLILFFFGLAVLSFDVNSTIAVVATTMIVVILLLVAITMLCSVISPSCPYRTPLSTSLLVVFTYSLNKLAPSLNVIADWWKSIDCPKIMRRFKKTSQNAEQSSWGRLTSNTRKLWALDDENSSFTFWVEDIWSGWDKILHLSSNAEQSAQVSWKIISWLIGHQPVSADVITQCFSNLPGSPPPNVGTDETWLEVNRWRTRDKITRSSWQFGYLCQALADSLGLPTLSAEDFTRFLNGFIWGIPASLATESNEQLMPFNINVDAASFFRRSIQKIDPPTRNGLLKCISWLAKTILDERQFSLKQQDFGLFSNLLGIYFMLVDNRYPEPGKTDLYDVYHRMLVNIISADKPVRQRLGSSNVSDPSKPMDVQSRIEFAGNLLSFSCSDSRFDGTKSWRLEAKTIILYMSAAIQLADRWDLKTLEQLSVEDATITENINRASVISTKVFWALAAIVFDGGNDRIDELNKLSEYRRTVQPFLRTIQQVLEIEVVGGNGKCWKVEDNKDRSGLNGFLILNHKNIPSELLPTLKAASNERMNLDQMLNHNVVISPTSNEWIQTRDDYLGLLEELYNNNHTGNTGTGTNTAK